MRTSVPRRWLGVLLVALAAGAASPARAQLLSRYIPDFAPGLTDTPEDVQARAQPENRSQGVRVGSFVVRPNLSESLGYDSNVDGIGGGRASSTVDTQASVGVESDWSRNSVSAQLSVDDQRYPDRTVQDFTNWSAGLSGTHDFGPDQFAGSYSHLAVVQTPRDLGAVTSVPIPFQVDELKLAYAIATRGRLSLVPDLDVASYRFSNSAGLGADGLAGGTLGASLAQVLQSRVVTQGQLTTRYELSPQRYAVAVLRGTEINYTDRLPGAGNRDSTGGAVLVGLDYSATGLFRFRALVGYQQRDYVNAQYANISSPIVEASVTWTPQLLTTVTGTVRREIDDSTDVNFAAYTVTSVQLGVAHELRRNIILTGFAQYQRAEFDSSTGTAAATATGLLGAGNTGTQDIYTAGLGATWRLNRTTRLGLSYQFADRRAGAPLSYTENVALLTLGFGL